jgi:iron complex outermembrane receptor protein
LQYVFSPTVNAYVTYSRGFKGAAFDTAPANIANVVAPERSNAYEAGLRSSFLDHKLSVNMTLFRTDVRNLQLTLRDLTLDVSRLGSVAAARTQGIELDSAVTPLRGLTFTISGSRLDATYRSFANSPCYLFQTVATGCTNNVQNLTGRALVDAPKWKGVFGTRYEHPVGGLKGFVEYDARIQSKTYMLADDNPAAVQGGYAIQDLSFGLEDARRWSASIFVKNLADKHYVSGYGVNGVTAGGIILHTLPRDFGRYAGFTLSFHG